MATQLDSKDLITLQEFTISNMWEVAALIEVLEKKGLSVAAQFYSLALYLPLRAAQRRPAPISILIRHWKGVVGGASWAPFSGTRRPANRAPGPVGQANLTVACPLDRPLSEHQ